MDLDFSIPEPLGLLLITLEMLSGAPGPAAALQAQGTTQAVKELYQAVREAGVRVRDNQIVETQEKESGRLGKMHRKMDEMSSTFDVIPITKYTNEEIWACELAMDLATMLIHNDGLSASDRAQYWDNLRLLERDFDTHHTKHAAKKAQPGPENLRDLRAKVPPRH